MKGAFIVLEGIDGSGTTTQMSLLARELERRGLGVETTHEPSQGPVGRLLRQLLVDAKTDCHIAWGTMALLFAADRVDHVARTLLPAIERGRIVICDRYDLSSLIYQSLTAPETANSLSWIRVLNREAIRPDLTLVLDVPAEIAAERRQMRGGVQEVYETSELQRQLADAYAQAATFVPDDTLIHLDGSAAPGAVAESVILAVSRSGILQPQAQGSI